MTSRRAFLKQSALTAAAGASIPSLATALGRAQPAGDRTLRIALIGCGGRGRGAASQALSTAGSVELVAMADAFSDQLADAHKAIAAANPERVKVPEENRFVGFDAYKQAMDCDVDVVILATPPGFRPMHFDHAVSLGKHVFMEKPVAVDGPGIRQVLSAAADAREKDLKVGVGLQRRHSNKYNETIRRIQDGAIGDVILLRSYWNSGGVWTRPRKEGQTEMEYQMRNWYYFNWLCGDHIAEQHIHNLDIANWIKGGPPAKAQGQGGRQVRTGIENGEIFDHHMVEFTYEDGTTLLSACRHIPGCWNSVSEHVTGSAGSGHVGAGRLTPKGGEPWRFRGEDPNHYQVEHDVLFAAIREGTPHNEAEYGATSTMTSIMGRMATYSGQAVTFDRCLDSPTALVPSAYDFNGTPPTVPDENGHYPIPMPGTTPAY